MEKKSTPQQEPTGQKLVDCETLAARYGVSQKFVRTKTREGFFPCVKLSRRCVRWPISACDKIIEAHRVNAISEV